MPSVMGAWTDAEGELVPGLFRIRDKRRPTIRSGWDVIGKWSRADDDGIVILEVSVVPSKFVFDLGSDQPRLRERSENAAARFRSEDLQRIKLTEIRNLIRRQAAQWANSLYFDIEVEGRDGVAERFVREIRQTASSRTTVGRPKTTTDQLDEWARDVIDALSWVLDKPDERSLYPRLMDVWSVHESTVKNARLKKLRETGRISGRGRAMTPGPYYPTEGDTHG